MHTCRVLAAEQIARSRLRVLAGRVTIGTCAPPAFMYEGHVADPKNVLEGLCRGPILLMACFHSVRAYPN
jgi:hypothetical protein